MSIKLKKHTLIALGGTVWLFVGVGLLAKGLSLVFVAARLGGQKTAPLLSLFVHVFTDAVLPATLAIIIIGLALGLVKGRFALARSVKRTVTRITPMEGRIKLSQLYRLHDYLLIIGMIALGRLMTWIHCPQDIHGLIDVMVGSALINGAMIYFRYFVKMRAFAVAVES